MTFVKLDSNILTSSVWLEDSDTVRVWIYLLASADADGVVAATVPGIALQNGLPVDKVRAILERFASPDPDSRTSKADGRRIHIDREPQFEIHLLNYGRYRRKDHTHAARQARYRARLKIRGASDAVTPSRDTVTASRGTQEEAEAKEVQKNSSEPRPAAAEPPSPVIFKFPTVGKVRDWPFTEAVLNEYRELYPVLNVEASARRALHWLTVIKPTGKKTARGMHRFLNGWFERAIAKGEDLAATGSGTRPGAARAPSPEDLEAFRRAREDAEVAGKRKP